MLLLVTTSDKPEQTQQKQVLIRKEVVENPQ